MTEIDLDGLGDRLIALRKEKKLTQEKLAITLGLHRQLIQKYEVTGYRSVSLHRIVRIYRFLLEYKP